ncbi:hypothetical protein K435DRAFT_813848 [Dendrothele bispora CBS 962.96]|uniref:Helicase C-terminal domain-containing protein n=1 Tax=Dendrothele bispora (strain CBS 962.96) TaxID=1314807 RepID=A0A4S8KKC9_DENBC|nr:hypothetical protein K435DRAFT_813848 [Dendrothele bispora CBS 962.96]
MNCWSKWYSIYTGVPARTIPAEFKFRVGRGKLPAVLSRLEDSNSCRSLKRTAGSEPINAVKDPESPRVSQVANVGLNLTIADVVIFFDQPWSGREERQIIGQAHRQPQWRTVKVIHIRLQSSYGMEGRVLYDPNVEDDEDDNDGTGTSKRKPKKFRRQRPAFWMKKVMPVSCLQNERLGIHKDCTSQVTPATVGPEPDFIQAIPDFDEPSNPVPGVSKAGIADVAMTDSTFCCFHKLG